MFSRPIKKNKYDALAEQLDLKSFVGLSLCQLTILLLWFKEAPTGLIFLLIATLVCRWRIIKGQISRPSWIIKGGFITFSIVLWLTTAGKLGYDLSLFTQLLLLAYSLKALETETKRDAVSLVYLGLFIQCSYFLYSQAILMSLFQVCILILHFASLQAIHQREHLPFKTYVKPAVIQVGLALPFMLVLFVFFPRFPPLWNIPLDNGKAITGLSTTMSPGDIAEIALSDELVFRAEFTGEKAKQQDLYWRAITLNYFNGKTWGQQEDSLFSGLFTSSSSMVNKAMAVTPLTYSSEETIISDVNIALENPVLQYKITVEANQQHWLFSLYAPRNIASGTRILPDYTLYAEKPINAVFGYQLTSDLGAKDTQPLNATLYKLLTQLPAGNPKSRQFSRQLYQQSHSPTDFVNRLNQYIKDNAYFYSLQPGALSTGDQVDELWFDQKTGFCAHYASAMTFMLRAQNIPARIVTGYMGGQWSDNGNYINVRQMEAHAWVEYWQEGIGWMRADPTAAIAPERILGDLTNAIDDARELISHPFFSSLSSGILSQMHWFIDDLQYSWRKWVVNFDNQQQRSFYDDYLEGFSWEKVGLIIGGSLTAMFVFFILWVQYKSRLKFDNPVKKQWYLLQKSWQKQGLNFDEKASAQQQLATISIQKNNGGQYSRLSALLNCYFYTDKKVSTNEILKLIKKLKH